MPSKLESIRHLSETLFQHTNVDDMVRQVLHTALEVIGEDAGSILLADEYTKQLVFRYVIGTHADRLHGTSIPLDKGIAGAVYSSGKAEVIPAVQHDTRHLSDIDRITGYQSRDMIVVPLKRYGGTPIGVIEVLNKVTGQIDREDLDILVVIASIAAAAIERTNNAETLRQKDLQLQQSQKMEAMGRMAGGVAHDFNNLLTVIRGFTELIVATLPPESPQKQYAQEVLKAAKQGSDLISQLLTFSRKQVVERRIVNVNDIVSNIENILRRLLGKDVQLFTNLAPQLGLAHADPSQLEQVIMNLSVNARDAMPQGGSLTIQTRMLDIDEAFSRHAPELRPGRHILLSVTDTGSGMDQATQARLFEPFFTTKPEGKGTGLGLSIVYGIVKQSHGHLTVASKIGQGTTFNIYLPQVESSATDGVAADLATTLSRNGRR